MDLGELRSKLHRIDGRGYKAYKDIKGAYRADTYELFVDHVQGDPFAAPSHLRLRVSKDLAGFPPETYSNRSREIALRDYLTRSFYRAAGRLSKPNKGSGKSGLIGVDRPGQEILERSSVVLGVEWIELRFVMGLPAFVVHTGRDCSMVHSNTRPMQSIWSISTPVSIPISSIITSTSSVGQLPTSQEFV